MTIFDIETDGLNPSRIHCLSYTQNGNVYSLYKYNEIKEFILKQDVLIGHNIIRFDVPVLERILNININARLIDTLGISWYLYQNVSSHGLGAWGERLGVSKPEIKDWSNLSLKEYIHRCEEDVKINYKLWMKIERDLNLLYPGDELNKERLIKYISFKLDCTREQEETPIKLNVGECERLKKDLEGKALECTKILSKVMPKVPVYGVRTRPKVWNKKDGSLSANALKWLELLKEMGLPDDYSEDVEVILKYEEPNPGSHTQVKDWLYGLGWKPTTFKYVRNKDTNEVRRIEQIKDGDDLCESVKRLAEQVPEINSYTDLMILNHRISVLQGFLDNHVNGYLKAEVAGFTNTFRFRHKVLVNIPSAKAPYGLDIRALLVADDGNLLCGSDMSSLEDKTKQHYMYPYDPEYVKEMQKGDYDPHLDLAIHAGALTEEQVEAHKIGIADYSKERSIYKVANYACVYGAGARRLADAAGISEAEGRKLRDAYWQRNQAVISLSKDQKTKTCLGSMWLLNPVSRFWMPLRNEKDVFSTLNQSTGVYCFDRWITELRREGVKMHAQFHDEVLFSIPQGKEDYYNCLLHECIEDVNSQLFLNVDLGIDVKFGESYAEVH